MVKREQDEAYQLSLEADRKKVGHQLEHLQHNDMDPFSSDRCLRVFEDPFLHYPQVKYYTEHKYKVYTLF